MTSRTVTQCPAAQEKYNTYSLVHNIEIIEEALARNEWTLIDRSSSIEVILVFLEYTMPML